MASTRWADAARDAQLADRDARRRLGIAINCKTNNKNVKEN
jgi:hypothetical protein